MNHRVTAAALYLLLTVLALGALGLLVTPLSSTSWAALTSIPGSKALVIVLATLGLLSLVVACVLVIKRASLIPLRWPVKTIATALPIVAFGWNFIAPIFWLLPLLFIWRSPRGSQP